MTLAVSVSTSTRTYTWPWGMLTARTTVLVLEKSSRLDHKMRHPLDTAPQEEFRRAQAMMAKRIKEIKGRKAEIAYHEAGHAVVARVLGISITHATILPDETSLASVGWRWRNLAGNANQADALEKHVVVFFAGPHAQSRYRPARKADDWDRKTNDWNGDIEQMSSWAASIAALRHGLPLPEDGAMAPFPDSLKPELGHCLNSSPTRLRQS